MLLKDELLYIKRHSVSREVEFLGMLTAGVKQVGKSAGGRSALLKVYKKRLLAFS